MTLAYEMHLLGVRKPFPPPDPVAPLAEEPQSPGRTARKSQELEVWTASGLYLIFSMCQTPHNQLYISNIITMVRRRRIEIDGSTYADTVSSWRPTLCVV